MDTIFKKLNYKTQSEIVVLNSPDTFRSNLEEISKSAIVFENLKNVKKIFFILIFATKKMKIDSIMPKINKLLADEDIIVWFAYPKGTSKKYSCDFNRDTGWDSLGEYGFEAVRMVAIDEDWSALRFRKVEYIKKMIRRKSMSLSSAGKNKTKGK